MQNRRRIFILAACEDGPLIFPCTDALPLTGPDGKTKYVGVGASLMNEGIHCGYEIDTQIKLLQARYARAPHPVQVIDVGANVGSHTLAYARAVDQIGGQVLAIEAQERLFYALCGNIALNNLFNTKAIWAAAGAILGTVRGPNIDYGKPSNFGGISMIEKFNGETGQGQMFYEKVIETVVLDQLGLEGCDFLKVDVEGMEPEVLCGAQRLINDHRPIIWVEFTTCGSDAIIQQLPIDYRCEAMGMNLLCMDKSDPVWAHVKLKGAAA